MRVAPFVALGLLASITACANGSIQVAVVDLEPASAALGNNNLEKVHDLVQDSQKKCADFVNALFRRSAETNVTLDIVGTALSAAATAITSISTAHILTAGATLVSGTRTSIDKEFLNSITISHITQAIQSTYTADLQKYLTYLDAVSNPDAISVIAERTRILSYHNECALPAANGSISTALQPNSPPETEAGALSVTYVVARNESPASIAAGILAKVGASAEFKTAGVNASPGPTRNTVSLKVPLGVTFANPTIVPARRAPEIVTFDVPNRPTLLTIAGTSRAGDAITLTATVQAVSAQAAAAMPVAGAPVPPLAAISGAAPQSK